MTDASWVVPFEAGWGAERARLGGKGANLCELVGLGVPVPPGFVIATDACRAYFEAGGAFGNLLDDVAAALMRVGAAVGRRFGDPEAPLLVSVRSGAPVSMPGMMDTILNVGLTSATRAGFARYAGQRTAADCHDRLRAMFGAVVGVPLPDDPHEQLERAIVAVFESWDSRRAQLYRRYHRIPATGTAVVVQAMVLGNAGECSGTGVAFTRNPSTGDPQLFGEYLPGGQGEDVVSGTQNVADLATLATAVPPALVELKRLAPRLERHFGDMCEIEFTLERGRLWILQSRSGQRSARAAIRVAVQLAHEEIISRAEALTRVEPGHLWALLHPVLDVEHVDPASVLTTATASSPGLATGVVVVDSQAAVAHAEAGERVVLVRPETTPEDLVGIIACAGLLTTRGGRTSHAAVVARGLGRTCVCGAEEIVVDEQRRELRTGAHVVREGDVLSLDGDGGRVILGVAPATVQPTPDELDELLRWADDARTLTVQCLLAREGDACPDSADGVAVRAVGNVRDIVALIGERQAALWIEGGDSADVVLVRDVAAAVEGLTVLAPPEAAQALSAGLPGVEICPAAAPSDFRDESLRAAVAAGARGIVVAPDRLAAARLAAGRLAARDASSSLLEQPTTW